MTDRSELAQLIRELAMNIGEISSRLEAIQHENEGNAKRMNATLDAHIEGYAWAFSALVESLVINGNLRRDVLEEHLLAAAGAIEARGAGPLPRKAIEQMLLVVQERRILSN